MAPNACAEEGKRFQDAGKARRGRSSPLTAIGKTLHELGSLDVLVALNLRRPPRAFIVLNDLQGAGSQRLAAEAEDARPLLTTLGQNPHPSG